MRRFEACFDDKFLEDHIGSHSLRAESALYNGWRAAA